MRVLLLLSLLFGYLLEAQERYKYSYIPKQVYQKQLFPLTIIGIGVTSKDRVAFDFDTTSPTQPISTEPLVVRNGEDSFFTFYFKAHHTDITTPTLLIQSQHQSTTLPQERIRVQPLATREDFSGLLATDLSIKNSQLSNYDENNSMLTLSIEAFEANIEDMNISHAIESHMESFSRSFAKVSAELYLIIPSDKKEIAFTYFNTIKQQFILLHISTALKDTSVATQSDLNPKEDNFEKLKKYAMAILSIFFTVMLLFRRDLFYLLFASLSILTFLSLFIPHKKICIKEGTPLYLLPTSSSTVSTYITKDLQTSLLAEHDTYTKIEYQKGRIGWIKNENICKD
jgi:hypothetical protein